MNCQQVRQNLLFYLDDELTAAEHAAIDAHLAVCPDCRAELERLRALRTDLSAAIPAGLAQLRLSNEAARRIKSRLQRARLQRARQRPGLSWSIFARPRPALLGALISAILLVCLLTITLIYPLAAPVQAQETLVVVPQAFTPDTDAALRVLVRQSDTAHPVEGAQVTIHLRGDNAQVTLYSGSTDAQGTVDAQFHIPDYAPDALDAELIVETRSGQGQTRIVQPVEVRRTFRVLLASDKPLYRPGQTVHLRALALEALTGLPADGREITFTVENPQRRVLLRQTRRLSAYGIAWADLDLPADAPHGQYRLTAALGDTLSERTVTVGQYETPRFRVEIDTAQTYYLPGETVQGTVRATQLNGAPISGLSMNLNAYLEGRQSPLATVTSRTDAQGNAAFSLTLPGTLAAEQTTLALQAAVTGPESVEWAGKTVPVSARALIIDAVPEGGRLRPGVENRVYLLVTTPDGAPVQAGLDIGILDRSFSLTSDAFGLAEFTLTPPSGLTQAELYLMGHDAAGRQVTQTVILSADEIAAQVLLRPDRAAYEVGETMHLDVFSGQGNTVYLDVVRGGQTLSAHILDLQDGRVALPLDISADMAGTLELHAYQILDGGAIIQDTRFAVVDAVDALDVTLQTDKSTYAPGETARIRIDTALNGAPIQSAIGIAVVDESVFALEARAPGFAKLFFLLEKELLQARERGFSLPALLDPPAVEAVRNAQDVAARAAWANLPAQPLTVARATSPARRTWPWWLPWLLWGLGVLLVLSIVVGLIGQKRRNLIKASAAPPSPVASDATHRLRRPPPFHGGGSPVFPARGGGDFRTRAISFRTMAVAVLLSATLLIAWLGGCQPQTVIVEKEVTKEVEVTVVVKETVVVEKEAEKEVTKVVEKEVTEVVEVVVTASPTSLLLLTPTPAGPQATPTPALEPTQPLQPTRTPQLALTPPPPPPLLGQFMPETILWLPEAITDPDGHLEIDVPLPDPDTTWRFTALASTQQGQLGTATLLIKSK